MSIRLTTPSTVLLLGEKAWQQQILLTQFTQLVQQGSACFWLMNGIQQHTLQDALELAHRVDRWGDIRILAYSDEQPNGLPYRPFWARTQTQVNDLMHLLGVQSEHQLKDLQKQLPQHWQNTSERNNFSIERMLTRHEIALLPALGKAEANVLLADLALTLDSLIDANQLPWPPPAVITDYAQLNLKVLQRLLKDISTLQGVCLCASDKQMLSLEEVEFWQQKRPTFVLSGGASDGLIKAYTDLLESVDETLPQRWHECPSELVLRVEPAMSAQASAKITAFQPLIPATIGFDLPFPRLPAAA